MLSDLCPDLSSGSPAGKFEHAFGLGFFFFFSSFSQKSLYPWLGGNGGCVGSKGGEAWEVLMARAATVWVAETTETYFLLSGG